MPQFEVGQPVRVRVGHEGCTWCEATQGRRGVIRAYTRLDSELMVDVQLLAEGVDGYATVPLKEDCIEAER